MVVVVEQDASVGVEAGYSPKSISILGTQILHTTALSGRENLQMSCFVHVFLNHTIVVHSLHEQQLLVFGVAHLQRILTSNSSNCPHGGVNNVEDSDSGDRSEKTSNIETEW